MPPEGVNWDQWDLSQAQFELFSPDQSKQISTIQIITKNQQTLGKLSLDIENIIMKHSDSDFTELRNTVFSQLIHCIKYKTCTVKVRSG